MISLEAPHDVQDTVFNLTMTNSASAIARRLYREFELDDGSGWLGPHKKLDHARSAANFIINGGLKPLQRVANSERRVLDFVLHLCHEIFSLETPRDRAHYRGVRKFVMLIQVRPHRAITRPPAVLDDALATVILNLLAKRGFIPDAFSIANDIAPKKRRHLKQKHTVGRYCTRSLALLQEVATTQTVRAVTAKALESSPLPPELVKMVGDSILEQRSIPVRDLVGKWNVPRPKIKRCSRVEDVLRLHQRVPPMPWRDGYAPSISGSWFTSVPGAGTKRSAGVKIVLGTTARTSRTRTGRMSPTSGTGWMISGGRTSNGSLVRRSSRHYKGRHRGGTCGNGDCSGSN